MKIFVYKTFRTQITVIRIQTATKSKRIDIISLVFQKCRTRPRARPKQLFVSAPSAQTKMISFIVCSRAQGLVPQTICADIIIWVYINGFRRKRRLYAPKRFYSFKIDCDRTINIYNWDQRYGTVNFRAR